MIRHRGAEPYGDRTGDTLGPRPKKAAVLEAEDTSPNQVAIDRNDRHLQHRQQLSATALEWGEMAGPADPSLGEDADGVALAQLLAGGVQGFDDLPRAIAGDRYRMHEAQQPMKPPAFVERPTDHEANKAL